MSSKYSIFILLLIAIVECRVDDAGQQISPDDSPKNYRDEQPQSVSGDSCSKEGNCNREPLETSANAEKNSNAFNQEGFVENEEVSDKLNSNEELIGEDKSFSESTKTEHSDGKEREKTDEFKSDSNVLDDKLEENNQTSVINATLESNSTLYNWLKFLLDPILEEFKDGIYPKLSDKTNITVLNVSSSNETVTDSIEIEAINITVTESANVTESENSTDTGKKVKFQCTGKNVTDNLNATVKLITTAQLLQMLNFDKNETENVTDCLLVMFYAPWCHFCAKIAPYYNALARAFPQLDFVAVDTAQFSNLLARFGTVSVPNILVFHQSRAAVKFNQTERTFENLITFVTNSTGLEANSTVNVTDTDYQGPVPSVPTTEPDYLLLISWIFVIFCSTCMFVKSHKGQMWINKVKLLWQEHQHID